MRAVNTLTSKVVANCQAARDLAMNTERIPASKMEVLYNGVDVARFRSGSEAVARNLLGIPPSARVVGIVANYRPVKDLALFLQSAAIIARAVPDTAFLLAGTGALYGELRELASSLGIGDRVFFSQGRGDIPDYLACMSIGCLTSVSEAFSNAILEYMAAGLPVVAMRVGGTPEAVDNGVTGFLVDEREPASFADAVIRLLHDEPLRKSMGEQGYRRCLDEFDLMTNIRRQEDMYYSLVR
jgi:glycosyltransferase involved in cell wall biosynthesis